MSAYRVWLETCKGCNPWTRVVQHVTTNEPIVQALHEPGCHVFPPLQRIEGQVIDRGTR